MKKKASLIKTCGKILGVIGGVAILGAAWVGFGEIFVEQYQNPDNWPHDVYQYARYGWSLKFNDGWAA